MFAQLELDWIGFLSPFFGRLPSVGPSFTLGFQYFMQ